jgi:hypothetical protein
VYASEMQLPPDFGFPKYGYWLSRLVDRTVWPGLGLTHDDLGAFVGADCSSST